MQTKQATVTGELLKEMAKKIWTRLPQYSHEEIPKFSNGWLDTFKARHSISFRIRRGEAASVDKETVEEELRDLRIKLAPYDQDDVYNIDEAALYWKMSPNGTLATASSAGLKLEKARITVNFCVNATGTHKLPLLFIGTAKTPRCFTREGINVSNLNMLWRSNRKAWMTGVLFQEYLQWFSRQTNRKVVLLVDGFSAHVAGYRQYSESNPESNVKVIFLPANATSICQPLDQGIIETFKAHYKRKWLAFLCDQYDADKDPFKNMHILQAIRWSITAWEYDVKPATIVNCWIKSLVFSANYGPTTQLQAKKMGWTTEKGWSKAVDQETEDYNQLVKEMSTTLQQLKKNDRIQDVISIERCLNPAEEIIEDDDDDILDTIVDAYAEGQIEESDEDEIVKPTVKYSEAIQALRVLRTFYEQQEDGDIDLIQRLNTSEQVMLNGEINTRQQMTITNYFR